jgi:iron complex outermembrane receptor protein
MFPSKSARASAGGAVLLAAAFAAPAAKAQQAIQTDQYGAAVALPTVDAPAVQEPAAGSDGSLTAPSVAEQRRRIDQTVGSVAFVDADTPEIQTRHLADLRDALKDVPGVYVETRYGAELRLSIRGSGLARPFHLRGVDLLQDGIPMNYADGGGDFYQIDPLYFRSIEIFKGGNALAFGTSTLGGAINFISPTAYTALAPDMILMDGGSFGSIRGQVQASRIIGDFDFLINGTFSHADGYRDHSISNYEMINGTIGNRFAPGAETRFYFGAYYTQQLLPGTLSLFNALNNPAMASPFASYPGYAGNQSRNVFNQRLSNKTTLLTDFGRIDVDSWFIHNALNHPIYLVLDQEGVTWGVAPRLTSQFDLGGFRNDLTIGARVYGGQARDARYVNFDGHETTQVLNARQAAQNYEIYAENRFFVTPELALMAGVKAFSDARKYTDLGGLAADPNFSFNSITYRGILPKGGVIWRPRADIQIFADITGSRDVPDFIDLTQTFNPITPTFVPLAAQKAWTGEIGTRGRWDRFTWDFTAYRSDLRDELLQYTVGGALGVPANTFNASHTIHQGIEFAAGVDLLRDLSGPGAGDSLRLSQVWTWNDFAFVDDPVYGNNPLAGIPVHVLRTTLAYRRPDGLYAAPSLDWVPAGAYVDYAHTLQTPGYLLLGAQAGVTLPQGISLYLDARNLTNQRYISDLGTVSDARAANTEVFYPGNGRAIYGGLRYRF